MKHNLHCVFTEPFTLRPTISWADQFTINLHRCCLVFHTKNRPFFARVNIVGTNFVTPHFASRSDWLESSTPTEAAAREERERERERETGDTQAAGTHTHIHTNIHTHSHTHKYTDF